MTKPLCTVVPKLPKDILYGGDYNPEQWPESVWTEDAQLMREAGVNLVSVAIFSWAKLEPKPGQYTFEWLDRVIDILWKEGVSVCLANATASPPAWLIKAHPEAAPVDEGGVRLSIGSRQHYCPNSTAYRNGSAELTRRLVQRYSKHPAVALWHINNEIGCHVHACFCEVCAAEFRGWLKNRYTSLEQLNESWGTAFWSQAYGEWDEILPPRKMPTLKNPGHALDYQRFMSDTMRDILTGEVQAIRSVDPEARVSTNGVTLNKPTDYWEYYRHVDVAAWDAYPDPALGLGEICATAFSHDLFRNMKGGLPFILMEQVTSQVNWRPNNVLKAPGQMRALSYQAVAHGADGVMFFQWRASRAGAEKFHGAMLPHAGKDGRVYQEVKQLGLELKRLRPLLGARTKARVAILKSWDNRWALELESKPRAFDYSTLLVSFYRPLWDLNIAVDVVHPDADISGYEVVVAPALYQVTKSQAERLTSYVEKGGSLIVGFFSGIADEREHIWLGGYPAPLAEMLGIMVEEWQPMAGTDTCGLKVPGTSLRGSGSYFSERVHLRGASAWATYESGIFAGGNAVTTHKFGQGEAFYVSTLPDAAVFRAFYQQVLDKKGIAAPATASPGVELAVRSTSDADYLFVINQTGAEATVDLKAWKGTDLLEDKVTSGKTSLAPYAVKIIARTRG